jgi:hypothetical protein
MMCNYEHITRAVNLLSEVLRGASNGGQPPTSDHNSLRWNPSQVMWDLWWEKWQ